MAMLIGTYLKASFTRRGFVMFVTYDNAPVHNLIDACLVGDATALREARDAG